MIDFAAQSTDRALRISADALRLREAVIQEAQLFFSPRTMRGIAETADAVRILPSSTSSEGGPFRTSRVPYMRKIMDALQNPRVQTVVVMKGAQTAGTTIAENWILWTMLESPSPMLAIWPTEKLLQRWSLTRLDKMIESTPELKRLFNRSGLRDSNDSIAHKEGPGWTLDLLTARSSSDLRSISARRLWFSEVDNVIQEIASDGDPFELARSRGETFWDYKELFESTPTEAGHSRIWAELIRTTWNDWWQACPHCGLEQVFVWSDGMEDGDLNRSGSRRFVWERDKHGEVIPGSVTYACQNGCSIEEHHKVRMLAAGEWRPRHPERTSAEGFHIPAWISPFISWTRIAQRFMRATKVEARMRTFINNICGLPYTPSAGRVLQPHFLRSREEEYDAPCPSGVRVLVASCDVQADRIEVMIVGYGAGEEAWVIEWAQLDGEPALSQVWRDLGAFLRSTWTDASRKKRSVSAVCIDARYQSERVHRFAANWVGDNGARAIPIVGVDGRPRPVLATPPPSKRRRAQKRKPARQVGTDTVKDLLVERLAIKEPGPGYIHFPEGLDPAFYEQLTSEELRTEYRKKRPVRVWRLKREGLANEALDLSVYAYAALTSLGSRVLADLSRLAREQVSGERIKESATPAAADSGKGGTTPRAQRRSRVISQAWE